MQGVQLAIDFSLFVCDFAVSKKYIYVAQEDTLRQFLRRGGLMKTWQMRVRGDIARIATTPFKSLTPPRVFLASASFVEMFREDGSFVKFIVCDVSVNSLAVSETNVFVSTHYPHTLRIFDLNGVLQRLVRHEQLPTHTSIWQCWHRMFPAGQELYVIAQRSEDDAAVQVVSATDGTLLREFDLSNAAKYWCICIDTDGGLHIACGRVFTHWCPDGQKNHRQKKTSLDKRQAADMGRVVFDSYSGSAAVLCGNTVFFLSLTK